MCWLAGTSSGGAGVDCVVAASQWADGSFVVYSPADGHYFAAGK